MYTAFQRRWQIHTYFQLRWKEIVVKFEEALVSTKLDVIKGGSPHANLYFNCPDIFR